MIYIDPSNNAAIGGQGGNYFLIGFMGSGKTHWGKIWASANKLSFVDLDENIEKQAGEPIASIFETKGEDHFRKLEAAALRNCANLQNTIVACGGGTPCFYENIKWMNALGITIYISCTSTEILERVLSEKEKRPLLKKLNQAELLFFIEQKLKERAPFYLQAKLKVSSGILTENSFSELISTFNS